MAEWRKRENPKYRMSNAERMRLKYAPRCTVAFIECRYCGQLSTVRSSRAKKCRRAECVRAFNAERMRTKYAEHVKAHQAKRRATERESAETIQRRDIYGRDGWTCGICSEPVDQNVRYPDPMSASLDHVVPISLGGNHVAANLRCAHLICNMRRGNRAA